MKLKTLLFASLLSVGVLAACSAQDSDDMKKIDDSLRMENKDQMSGEKKDMTDEKCLIKML